MTALLLAAASLAAGCAGPRAPGDGAASVDARWLHDERFGPPREAVSTAHVFDVNEAMRQYLARDIGGLVRRIGPKAALVEALFTRGALQIEYQGSATRNAPDAFAARAGNCLSLVVLTAALARELGLPVRFQSAVVDDVWSRDGDLLFESGHVNITIDEHPANSRRTLLPAPTTIDFLPPADIARMRLRSIGAERIEAMFANNRAVEALARGEVDDAYAWARHAVLRDPAFASGWNTLGVVYLRQGVLDTAAMLFDAVASAGVDADRSMRPTAASPTLPALPELEPSLAARSRALSNLATARDRQGRAIDAERARQRLAAIDRHPPFHFFRLGQVAAAAGDWQTARTNFAMEARRSESWHEFHFWHGLAAWHLGDIAGADHALALARETSPDAPTRDRYTGKLAGLRSALTPPTAGDTPPP